MAVRVDVLVTVCAKTDTALAASTTKQDASILKCDEEFACLQRTRRRSPENEAVELLE